MQRDPFIPHLYDPKLNEVTAVIEQSVREAVPAGTDEEVINEIRTELLTTYQSELDEVVRESISEAVGAFFGWGYQEHYWIGFYEFMPKLGVVYDEASANLLRLWGLLSRAMGWWAPFEGLVYCCERATTMKINERRVLHSHEGPAVAFADGWKIYQSDGNLIPARIVEHPETITLEEINKEDNIEMRRTLIELMGWEKYLKTSNAKVVETSRNDIANTTEALMQTDRERVLLVVCATGRLFAIEVPPDTPSVAAAQQYLSPFKARFVAET